MIESSTSGLLDWLYPPSCVLCKTPTRRGQNICHPCRNQLPRPPASSCLRCAQAFDGNIDPPSTCPNCIDLNPQFSFAISALRDHSDTISLIHHLKLLRHPELATDLAQIAAEAFQREPRLSEIVDPILIPIPLHGSRLRERGFNQAEAIARPLSSKLGLDCDLALKRIRATPRQATLSRKERRKNLAKAFQLRTDSEKIAGRNLILIDDVFTTGSTVNECARALQGAKPAQISVFTIMRA